MGIKQAWNGLFGRTEVKSLAESHRLIEFLTGGTAEFFDNKNYRALSEQGYIRNIIAGRCIQIISQGVGSLKWIIKDSRGRVVEDGELFDLLARPNPVQGSTSFFHCLEMYKLISGNTYIQSVRSADNRPPSELYVLRPDRMKVEPGAYMMPKYYEYNDKGVSQKYPVDPVTGHSDILHLYFPHPLDDWYGLSPLTQASREIAIHNQGSEWNKSLLQNGARPSGMLSTEHELSEDVRNDLKQFLANEFQGPGNAGRPMVGEMGLKWVDMQMSPRDVDFIKGRDMSARDIANAFGIPGQLIGLPDAQTYNNVREAKLAAWEETIMPEADVIVTELNHWLMPMFGEYTIEYDLDAISALSPRRQEKWDRVEKATFLSRNEKREELGFEPDTVEENVTQTIDEAVKRLIEANKAGPAGGPEPDLDEGFDDGRDDVPLMPGMMGEYYNHYHTYARGSILEPINEGVSSEDVGHTHTYQIGDEYSGDAVYAEGYEGEQKPHQHAMTLGMVYDSDYVYDETVDLSEPLPKSKPDEKAIVATGESSGHKHTVDTDVKNGRTSETADHSHAYTLGAEYTGISEGHKHMLPSIDE